MGRLGKVFASLLGMQTLAQEQEEFKQAPGSLVTLDSNKVVVEVSNNNSQLKVKQKQEVQAPNRFPGQVDQVRMGGEEIKAGTLH